MLISQLSVARLGARTLVLKCEVATSHSFTLQQRRNVHESYIPAGQGGRSSFSGVVATVFGGTGFVGHALVNRLARHGSSIVLPHRGSDQHINRLKVMSDLGQMLLRKFSIKDDDDRIRELIEYSNCVVNLIGSNVPFNNYSLQETNVDWPLRLARLVAEKNDGTRLLQITNLNCSREESRKVSKLMQMNYDIENRMREIYPETIIARSSNAYGMNDTYTNFFMHERFEEDLSLLGAVPLLYDCGRSTTIMPIYVGDLAEGLTRILKHLDAPGQTFELVGPRRYILKDFVTYLYKVFQDKPLNLYDTLGPMDKTKANVFQKLSQKMLDLYFKRQMLPHPYLPRALDLLMRRRTHLEQWTSKDYFNQIHLTDLQTGKPGLEELGIEPTIFEDKAHVMWGYLLDYHNYTMPSLENFPDIKQQPTHVPRIPAK